MTDKEDYYVPEIEEFYHGFEFEQVLEPYEIDKPETKKWTKVKYSGNINSIGGSVVFFQGYDVRVKHLDREDIENFGFELDQCTKDGCVFYKGNLMSEEEWCLTFGGKTNPKNYLSITSMKNNPNSFTGTVKNKSELKIILKMLGIL